MTTKDCTDLNIGEKYVIILAGGVGERMETDIPKQFIPVHGKPILMHSISTFYNCSPAFKFIVVLPQNHVQLWKDLCIEFNFTIKHQIINGGNNRFESVKNALDLVEEEAMVAIHDGVRPLVRHSSIRTYFENAFNEGSAIPVIPIPDSIRRVRGDKSKAVHRDKLKIVQTPQVFKASLIKKAYERKYRKSFTDDATVFEADGNEVSLVQGYSENIKITNPGDLYLAEAFLSRF